jgi:UDP-N-acetyl-D-mannosaminuronate dehydrogenase
MVLTQWETLCGLFFAFFEKIVVPILTSGGYVGLSLSVLLAQHNQVMAVDIVQAKVDMINNHKSPIQDDYIEKYVCIHHRLDGIGLSGRPRYLKLSLYVCCCVEYR